MSEIRGPDRPHTLGPIGELEKLGSASTIVKRGLCSRRQSLLSKFMLQDFITANREDILDRMRERVAGRNAPLATEVELKGVPVFFDQLCEALRKATANENADQREIQVTASQRGTDLFHQGLTVAQVVHDYGDLCQVITSLAVDQDASIPPGEFRTLNLCLDDAIAGAVAGYAEQRERSISDAGTERLGALAHEMRNLLNTAIMSFASIKRGVVAPGGSTSAIHERSLLRLNTLIDCSLADVRLDAGMQNLERVPLWEIIEEVEIGATMVAQTRDIQFAVSTTDHALFVDADRQILCAAVANLLQNAFKFTRPKSIVHLRTTTSEDRVLIEVEDGCGGLPPHNAESLVRPFQQQGENRTGLGLGLSICLKAVKAIKGELRIKDLPGQGCIFTIDLPLQPPPPTPIHARKPKLTAGQLPSGGGQLTQSASQNRAG